MDEIAILIPCYNESRTIVKVVNDWKQALPNAAIYVYDNNSSDQTAALAREAGAIVRHEYQQGKGNVIRRMFREIDAKSYLMVDGDDTYPAEFGREMIKRVLEHHADMVVGDRLSSTYFTENKRPFHNFGNSMVRKCINKLFKNNIKDIMTGYRAFSYNFVKTFPVLSKGFEIETEMSIHAVDKNMHVENVIIEYRDRPDGSESKLNTYRDGLKVLRTIMRLYRSYKPLSFFSAFAVFLAIISTVFLIPVITTYAQTRTVPNFPTLIVCCFVYLAAIISFFTGLILSSIVHQEKQNFEIRLIACQHRYEQIKKDKNQHFTDVQNLK
ncbi:MAG: glycosyltransferase family 2 protein [Muricomes sp.]